MDEALREEGLPQLDLWEKILGRKVRMVLEEDNQAALQVVTTGNNPNMRHMARTHGVCTAWLHEVFANSNGLIVPRYCETVAMAADLFTKAFTDAAKWLHAIALVGLTMNKTKPDLKPSLKSIPTPFGRRTAGTASTVSMVSYY